MPDGLQENSDLVYLKDAYGTKLAPVALSSEVGMTDTMLCSTSSFPDNRGDGLFAPRDVPAEFGTTVCTTGGVDRHMSVFAPDSSDSTIVTVPQMELLTLEGTSGMHPDSIVVWLDGTDAVRDDYGMTGLASPFITVVRPKGFARTYDCGSDSPDFLDMGDSTPCLPVPRLRRCLRVLDFACDFDPGPDLSGREAVSASDEPSGALALTGEPLPAAPRCLDIFCWGVSPQPLTFRDFMQKTAHASPTGPVREDSWYINPSVRGVGPLRSWRVTKSHLFGLPVSSALVVWESPGLPVREECSYICAEVGDARSLRSDLVTELHLFVLHVCRGLVFWASTTLHVREGFGYI